MILSAGRSERNRYYKDLEKFVNKYDLTLVAGNFFQGEHAPCVEDGRDRLDHPEPQYVQKAEEKAQLPAFPRNN